MDVFYQTVFDSLLEHECMHMLVIYIEYQGPFMFANTKQMKKKNTEPIRFSARPNGRKSQSHVFKTTFWNDVKCCDMSTFIEDESREQLTSDLNLWNGQEMLSCHVTVSPVCWQKCHFQGLICASCQSRQPIAAVISASVWRVQEVCAERCVDICVYLTGR